jgi:hypothetical protein
MDWLALLTAFGVGSIVSVGVQSWLDSRKETRRQRFSERREAYIGLLEAYHRVARENSPESRLNFGYWELRCRLVASESVSKTIEDFATTFPGGGDRKVAEETLLLVMRRDLES